MPSGGGAPEIKSVKSGGCSGPLITEAEGALFFDNGSRLEGRVVGRDERLGWAVERPGEIGGG